MYFFVYSVGVITCTFYTIHHINVREKRCSIISYYFKEYITLFTLSKNTAVVVAPCYLYICLYLGSED